MEKRTYIAIDLKSFYASVECVERNRNPLTANLVVADESRTEKTICLAVSPALKSYGIPGRARLFEVIQKVNAVNAKRLDEYRRLSGKRYAQFSGKSDDAEILNSRPDMAVDFIIAPPQMAHYMEISTQVYKVYLKYAAPEDIHVYSIDEVFIDVTAYLDTYKMTAHELTVAIIRDVLATTGITATAGIGTNMYLCKIAMDIVAKRMPADKDGVRIAELDEMSYRRLLWNHRPLTDFWRIGRGYSKKLEAAGLFTMGDIARFSLESEDYLYKLFGVNAELLIDHAWGWEPCTIADIKRYSPENNSISSGQVLQQPCDFEQTELIVREMADLLVFDLVEKGLVTDQLVLTIGYDSSNLTDENISRKYKGDVTADHYGRKIPKHAHGTINLDQYTSSTRIITEAAMKLYRRIMDRNLTSRRIYIVANHVISEKNMPEEQYEQLDFFTDHKEVEKQREKERNVLEREKRRQQAILGIKKKYGKNAIIKGMNLQEGATAIERNKQVGGHKA